MREMLRLEKRNPPDIVDNVCLSAPSISKQLFFVPWIMQLRVSHVYDGIAYYEE